ncbi:glycerophosphodiester phosphodiesterase family protein, partial [Salmonella enterica]
ARKAGAEMCECDVQFSGDGEVVIFHDEDLAR